MVKIKLFANFREIVGKNEIEVSAATVIELLRKLVDMYPDLRVLIFRNGDVSDYVHIVVNGKHINKLEGLNTKLKDDDTVAIFPPVSGG